MHVWNQHEMIVANSQILSVLNNQNALFTSLALVSPIHSLSLLMKNSTIS